VVRYRDRVANRGREVEEGAARGRRIAGRNSGRNAPNRAELGSVLKGEHFAVGDARDGVHRGAATAGVVRADARLDIRAVRTGIGKHLNDARGTEVTRADAAEVAEPEVALGAGARNVDRLVGLRGSGGQNTSDRKRDR